MYVIYIPKKFPLLLLINEKVKPNLLDSHHQKSNKLYLYQTNNVQNSLRANQKSFQLRKMDDYNTKIKLIGDCKNKREIFAKGVCLSVVLTSVN